MSPRPWRQVRNDAFNGTPPEVYGLLDQEAGDRSHSLLLIRDGAGFHLSALSTTEDGDDHFVRFLLDRDGLDELIASLADVRRQWFGLPIDVTVIPDAEDK